MEVWKDVKDYEGKYQISNYGNVKSLSRIMIRGNGSKLTTKERMLKPCLDAEGYFHIGLWNNGKRKTTKIHQLVAIYFLNHTPCGYRLVVNHKDFNRTNNHIDNLEITTVRENTNQKHRPSTSKYTGVSWSKRDNKWISKIVINGKGKYLGRFKSEEDAYLAYEKELRNIL